MKFNAEYIEIVRELHKVRSRKPNEWRRWDAFLNDEGFGIILNNHKEFKDEGIITMIYFYNSNEKLLRTYNDFNCKKYENEWCWVPTTEHHWLERADWNVDWYIGFNENESGIYDCSETVIDILTGEYISKGDENEEDGFLLICARAWKYGLLENKKSGKYESK